jgi:hypothetical protein
MLWQVITAANIAISIASYLSLRASLSPGGS